VEEKEKRTIFSDKFFKIIFYVGINLFWISLVMLLMFTNDIPLWIARILFGISILIFIFTIIYNFDKIKEFFKKIDWEKFGYKTYYILIVISILVIINVIASKRFYRADLTRNKEYTLSNHSLKLLKQLQKKKKEIKILFFRTPPSYFTPLENVEDLINEYKNHCNVIKTEFINPDKEPLRARTYNIRSIGVPNLRERFYGTIIILAYGLKESIDVLQVDWGEYNRWRQRPILKIRPDLEKQISSALLRLTKSKKKIYFVQGHDEVDLTSGESTGWLKTKEAIADENYIVDKLYLGPLDKVPDDCKTLIIAAPKRNFTSHEFQVINDYLNNGGSVLLLLEPLQKMNINEFLKSWGVKTPFYIVIDPKNFMFPQPSVLQVSEFFYHPIVKNMKVYTFFPGATCIQRTKDVQSDINITDLARTSTDAWAETSGDTIEFNKNVDITGPLTIIEVITKRIGENKKAKMVIIGDSDFASNSYLYHAGNLDLLLNTLNWLAGKEEMIGIRNKPFERKQIELSIQNTRIVFYLCVIVLPILVVIAGVIVWLKRR